MYHCIIALLSNCPTDSHPHCFTVLKTHWPTASLSCCLTVLLLYSSTVLQYTLYIARTSPKSRCPASTQPHCLTAPLLSSPSASNSLLLYHCPKASLPYFYHCPSAPTLIHCLIAPQPHRLMGSLLHRLITQLHHCLTHYCCTESLLTYFNTQLTHSTPTLLLYCLISLLVNFAAPLPHIPAG